MTAPSDDLTLPLLTMAELLQPAIPDFTVFTGADLRRFATRWGIDRRSTLTVPELRSRVRDWAENHPEHHHQFLLDCGNRCLNTTHRAGYHKTLYGKTR